MMVTKKRTKKGRDPFQKCTTIIHKKTKKTVKDSNSKSNKNIKFENKINKKDMNNSILSSLDLTLDNIENTIINSKTYKTKKKEIVENNQSNSNLDNSIKILKDK